MSTATRPAPAANGVAERKPDVLDATVEFKPFLSEETIKLSVGLILKYHCRPTKKGHVCSQEQAMRFLMLCKARLLNPWEGDAYLVGYDTDGGPEFNLITAHQAYLKRAEAHAAFDGMESGVLVVRGQELIELQGDFHNGDDVLVGAWAKVHRKDRGIPTYRRLKLATFNKGFSRWKTDPAGMIVKCAEADALRSSFPNSLAGMYFDGEMDDRPARQTPQQRVAGIKGQPAAIVNGTHTPAELVVRPDPAESGEPEYVERSEPTPLETHARSLEEADTPAELEAAYKAAFADTRLSKSDKAKVSTLRDERKRELTEPGPSEGDDDERAALEATK